MTPDDLKRAGVRVRKLEWVHYARQSCADDGHLLLSVTFDATGPIDRKWVARPCPPDGGNFPTRDDAISALERARENRILSALEPIHE